ncbi:ferrous iron transporter B [Verrucomicrobiaceae bacterium N1E253]|uniref:Ferrous iron transporter B n=1 Tax=Oceaniferula marina TaxID=2748318 RepID=A0A851GJI0_9BACT|nr:ferrous iron transporter B [Oceaniferula marina]NWK57162.1 ferrous iron transporter B [Oceaniferula marina]
MMETIALVGNPNCGKTTLFNSLTGANQKTGNYPGITVTRVSGTFRTPHGNRYELLDLPGCYSLDPKSPDEKITRDVLFGSQEGEAQPSAVVCVVDASNLERHLYLALQVVDLGLPVVVALNKVDLAESQGVRINVEMLAEELGLPVVPCQANTGKGVIDLKHAIRHPFPHPAQAASHGLSREAMVSDEALSQARTARVQEICAHATRRLELGGMTISDKIDQVVLHPLAGWGIFIGLMLGIFYTIFSVSAYPMGWVETGIDAVKGLVDGWMSEGDVKDLVINGVIDGVGSVVIFLPQILMLLFFIGLMETTGYMTRAAMLMDGLMGRVGLSGRAFLPLMSSYACAIPGIMATRSMDSAKQRLLTILIAPWMSCTARLPVYSLLIGMLMAGQGAWMQALVLAGVYALGTVTALFAAWLLAPKVKGEEEASHFLMELPVYSRPDWSYIGRHLLERAWAFIRNAGTVILGLCILLWALQTYPKPEEGSPAAENPSLALEQSYMGRVGHAIEPVVKPLGYDWRTGTALIASFAAREVFNANLAISYSVEEVDDEEAFLERLRGQLDQATWPDGRKIYTPVTTLSLLVFFVYALQCLPTTVVVRRESGSWKWALAQLGGMSLVAWLAAFTVYQLGSLLV